MQISNEVLTILSAAIGSGVLGAFVSGLFARKTADATAEEKTSAQAINFNKVITERLDKVEAENKALRSEINELQPEMRLLKREVEVLRRENDDFESRCRELEQEAGAYRKFKNYFEIIFRDSQIGQARVCRDGTILECNEIFSQFVGWPREEVVGRPFQERTYAEDLELDLELIQLAEQSKIDRWKVNKRYVAKDGRLMPNTLKVSALRDASGRIQEFLSEIQLLEKWEEKIDF